MFKNWQFKCGLSSFYLVMALEEMNRLLFFEEAVLGCFFEAELESFAACVFRSP